MAKKTSLIKWVFLVLAICVLLVVVVFLLTPANKHRTKVGYLAEYNRISKPANFDPNDNAAPYFDKAFELMVDAPDDFETLKKLWPADMNDDQRQIVGKWLDANKQTLDYLKQAISKRYYWKPRVFDNNEPLMMVDLNDLKPFRKAVYLLDLEAKLMAYQGQTEPALRQLASVYKMGTFYAGPKTLIEQLVGIAVSANAVVSAFQILDKTNPSSAILEGFQKQITSLSCGRPFLIDMAQERLMFDDGVRQFFTGREDVNFSENPDLYFRKLFLGTVGRPWAAWERRKADIMYGYVAAAAHKTPWELHKEGNDVDIVTDRMIKGTLFLRMLAPAVSRVLFISYRVQVQTDALIATTAILRYKADTSRYPKDLQELVTTGYLVDLPKDPFGGGPLTYKLSGDNFELYSFAEDLDDDGGKHDSDWAREGDGDYVFWPVQKIETTKRTKKQN
jgi:hypothetical protein